MFRSRYSPFVCLLLALVVICACVIIGISAGVIYLRSRQPGTPTPQMARPAVVSTQALESIRNTVLPTNDLLDLAERLGGQRDLSPTVDPPSAPFQVGDTQSFWITDQDTNQNVQVEAMLQYLTAHVYFWVQTGVEYDPDDLRSLVDTFETSIYPTNRKFFGSEWLPGVDGDVHLYMLYARGMGNSIAGYFSTPDAYPPQAHPYSNAHEMFMLNADNLDLADEFTYGVLAHEFQHMIHWNLDINESTWLNEGFSELAAFLNGYFEDGYARRYLRNPDLQLTDWPDEPRATLPHYGGSFLFVNYFLGRFGYQTTQALAAHPGNGMDSLDAVLVETQATDPRSGETLRADDIFVDWTLATYLNDPALSGGRYAYQEYVDAPTASATEKVSRCPVQASPRSVSQYGVDYIRITCSGHFTLRFEGSTQVKVFAAEPRPGSYAFWSNRDDMSDTTLTRQFDFSGYSGALALRYWTWYALEEGFDYAYLEASTDGETWTILRTPACTTANPSGNSYGCGYTGLSGGGSAAQWIEQRVDLSAYAGQRVWLRFEMITDAAVHLDGLLLDDLSVEGNSYASDFEQDAGGWEAAGFVRLENELPQDFRLALIYIGDETRVEYLPLEDDITAEIHFSIGDEIDEIILVVSGVTRYTRQPATYQYSIR